MLILDASALIAFLLNEPEGNKVEEQIRSADSVGIVTINLAEVYDTIERRHNRPQNQIDLAIDYLTDKLVAVLPTNKKLARSAGSIRSKLYKIRVSELSLADAFLIAACNKGDQILTKDHLVVSCCNELELSVVAL